MHPLKRGAVANWPEYEKFMFGCLYECALAHSLLDTAEHEYAQTHVHAHKMTRQALAMRALPLCMQL